MTMVDKYKPTANYNLEGLEIPPRNKQIDMGIYCSFEDCVHVYFFYGYPIFQWVAVTALNESAPFQ